ncbi:hypothetical protein HPP92_024558 [Vanilla planifolia]|uniref:Tetrapyrrole methylase domain-containing protein n=1 Tax=Vanilla planifolia TaxID=51239 RepID=A0A835PML2_VANPL|nr:hypothetical protein HPP92_024558 [Vanilla planifolia]
MLPFVRPFQIPNVSKVVVPSISQLVFGRFFNPNPSLIYPRCACLSCERDGAAAAGELPDHVGATKKGTLRSGLYLVATPIGNLEDITLRALRILKSADVILAEDTRHSWKLLQHYNIDTPLLSYHKFNESHREATIMQRLHEGQIVALVSDAGTPGVSDPGMELVKLCARENITVVPIPGPSAVLSALSACGLSTNEFTFVGFLPKHTGSRRSKLLDAANQTATQLFFVPPHKFLQFLTEASSAFGDSRLCVVAKEMTKIHEEFWRGTLGEAAEVFSSRQCKGEYTILIEGRTGSPITALSEEELEHELRHLISKGNSISTAVKMVAEATTVKRKEVYALALRLFAEFDETSQASNS